MATPRNEPLAQLLRAIREDRVDDVDRMLAEDVSLAHQAGHHPTWGGEPKPLHVAAERGHTKIVERLLDAEADASDRAASYGGWSPLLLATVKDHPETIDLLLARGAEVGLCEAAALGDLPRLTSLLEPDLSKHPAQSGVTALHLATMPRAPVAPLPLAGPQRGLLLDAPGVRCLPGRSRSCRSAEERRQRGEIQMLHRRRGQDRRGVDIGA